MRILQILIGFSALILWGCASGPQTVRPETTADNPHASSAPATGSASAEAREQVTGSSAEESRGYPYGDSMQPRYWELTQTADSPEYGRSQEHAVLVARSGEECSPANERLYLNALLGPNGESVQYERIGSCCAFETPNSPWGAGLLDVYKLTYDGLDEPITLYLNMYDPGEPLIPAGFTARSRSVTVDFE